MNLTSLFTHPWFAHPWRLMRAVAKRARAEQVDQVAGSLTFLTLLAIVPFITIGLALFSAFPMFADFQQAIERFLQESLLPEEVGTAVLSNVADFAANAANMTLAGLALLSISALMLMQTVERAFNRMWHTQTERSLGRRLTTYTLVLLLGPVLIGGSLAATTFLVSASLGFLPQMAGVDKTLLSLVPAVLTAIAFTLLYRSVPACPVRMRHAMAGGVLAAIAFEIMKTLFGLYIAAFTSYQLIYGAFAAIPIFLIWIYLSWTITLVGALVVAGLPGALGHNAAP